MGDSEIQERENELNNEEEEEEEELSENEEEEKDVEMQEETDDFFSELVKNRKAGISHSRYTHDGNYPFDSEKFFKGDQFDHVEKFEENKVYENLITIDYGKGEKKYEPILYTIGVSNKNNERSEEKWVVWEERIEKEELKKLEPYCRCAVCKEPWWFPVFFLCSHCVGCFRSTSQPPQSVLNRTRIYMKELEGNPIPDIKRIDELRGYAVLVHIFIMCPLLLFIFISLFVLFLTGVATVFHYIRHSIF